MANKHKSKGSPKTVSPGLGQTKSSLGDSELEGIQASNPGGNQSGAQPLGGISPEILAQFARFFGALSQIAPSAQATAPVAGAPYRTPLTREDADVIVAAFLDTLMRRVPLKARAGKAGTECPFSGLNRGQLYNIFAKRENGQDVVEHCTLAEEEGKAGAHFYNVGSVLKYLRNRAKQRAAKSTQT